MLFAGFSPVAVKHRLKEKSALVSIANVLQRQSVSGGRYVEGNDLPGSE
jgi:hypothetical protein